MPRFTHLLAPLFIAVAFPGFASSPGEDSGPAPQPDAGAGGAVALATGMTLADASAAGGVTSLPITYALFEAAVPHADLSECPQAIAASGRFCRLGLASDQLTIFVFSEEGDQPLLAVRSWPADAILPALK